MIKTIIRFVLICSLIKQFASNLLIQLSPEVTLDRLALGIYSQQAIKSLIDLTLDPRQTFWPETQFKGRLNGRTGSGWQTQLAVQVYFPQLRKWQLYMFKHKSCMNVAEN